jgi:hypothetical protein
VTVPRVRTVAGGRKGAAAGPVVRNAARIAARTAVTAAAAGAQAAAYRPRMCPIAASTDGSTR